MRLINADEHECWACKHHTTGKCDTWCDASESFELREDVKNAKTAFDLEEFKDRLIEELKIHFDAIYREDGQLLYSDHVCIGEDVEDLIKLIRRIN